MSDCIFCKIAAGEIPSNTVYENENLRIILDIAPANPGHCLVLPKTHAENIFEIDEELLKEAFSAAKKTASALKSAALADGVNILQNNGETAGQTVNHFHIHVIPRKKDDKVKLNQGGIKLSDEEMNTIKETIIKSLN